ncbi:alpha/beta hydrolase [Microbacteriaceae bacterium 4G12]
MARIPIKVRLLSALGALSPGFIAGFRGGIARDVDVDERSFPQPGGAVRMRVYTPKEYQPGRPLVVVFPADGAAASAWLPSRIAARLNAAVVHVLEPLSPSLPPEQRLATAAAAIAWSKGHAAGWGAAGDHLGVVGDGPGADLLNALMPRNVAERGPFVMRQVLVSPSDDVAPLDDATGFPGSLVLVSEHDQALDATTDRVDALKRAGVPARIVEYPGAANGWFRYPGLQPAISERALEDTVQFLRRGLREEDAFTVIPAWDLH